MARSLGNALPEGKKLVRGECLISDNGAYTLTLQDDGNLVLGSRDEQIWASGTGGQDVVRAEVQTDGNFVVYTADKPVWHTDTKGKKNVRLVLQDDRNLVLYSGVNNDNPVWSTKTETDAPLPPEPAEEKSGEGTKHAQRSYTVVAGDTLFAIAERFYGDGNRYPEIAAASGIANPDLIHPGQELIVP